jgi:hypothetical protein
MKTNQYKKEEKTRTTKEVLEDHLHCRKRGDVEGDLKRNFSEDVVILTSRGKFFGHNNVRHLNKLLHEAMQTENYEFPVKLVEGPYAFVQWRARQPGESVEDGADSFIIENGKITMQTIHYMIEETMPA